MESHKDIQTINNSNKDEIKQFKMNDLTNEEFKQEPTQDGIFIK